MAATTRTRASSFEVGSTLLVLSAHGPAAPAGTTHLVDGWEPVCGGERVRFVFPGRVVALGASCPECTEAAAVAATPRQLSTARTTASRSRAKAS